MTRSPARPMRDRRRNVGSACALQKSATNDDIRRDLLDAARASKINLSAILEQALIEQLRDAQDRQWREENRESIAAYNEHVEKHGVFSEGSRSF
ncbi:type II toxin-antitoxin system CcdA family antitoxin [Peristeroidobacter agariperforans]|uniref:type II toxin-antitoxin system CcdA family antitoxin n=1 Tax=Peristeroidobacter agariperforans TaxID=268404 RepID=UPI001E3F8757|nr:type II toxin-antitoxin system CcdA family antitoxin [Peristeroidobacter agariperforans]